MEVCRIVLLELNSLAFVFLVDVVSLKILQDLLDFPFVFIVDHDRLLFFFLLLIGLDLDTSLGHERLKRNLLGDFDHFSSIGLHGNVEHGGVDVGTSLDELDMDLVVEIQLKRSGNSFQSAPEGFSSVLDDVISRES